MGIWPRGTSCSRTIWLPKSRTLDFRINWNISNEVPTCDKPTYRNAGWLLKLSSTSPSLTNATFGRMGSWFGRSSRMETNPTKVLTLYQFGTRNGHKWCFDAYNCSLSLWNGYFFDYRRILAMYNSFNFLVTSFFWFWRLRSRSKLQEWRLWPCEGLVFDPNAEIGPSSNFCYLLFQSKTDGPSKAHLCVRFWVISIQFLTHSLSIRINVWNNRLLSVTNIISSTYRPESEQLSGIYKRVTKWRKTLLPRGLSNHGLRNHDGLLEPESQHSTHIP